LHSDCSHKQPFQGRRKNMSNYRQTQLSRCTRRYPVSHDIQLELSDETTLSFTHIKKGRSSQRSFDIQLEPVVFGRQKGCSITVDNSTLDPVQASITVLNDELLFLDRGRQSITSFNGRYGRQHITSLDDCTVIKLFDDYIIYHGLRLKATDAPESEVYLFLQTKDARRYYSEGRPLLIGASSNCEVPLVGEGMPEYAGAVFWTEYGIVLEPFEGNKKLQVNGYPITEAVLVQHNDEITYGENILNLAFFGDVLHTSQECFPPLLQEGHIGISVIHGPSKGHRAVLGDGSYSVGSGLDDDFCLDDPNLGSDAFLIVTRGFCFSIRKGPHCPPIIINGKEVRSGIVYPGDVMKVGENIIVPYFR
jgi:hypothetical protein